MNELELTPPATSASGATLAAYASITQLIAAGAELDEVLRACASTICELLNLSRCSTFLRHGDGPIYRGALGYVPSFDAPTKRLFAGTSSDAFTLEVVATRRPVLISDTRTDPRVDGHRMMEWQVRTILGVPMVLGEEVVGVLYLDHADQPYAFTEERQAAAASFADLAAIAVSQAQFVSELREQVRLVEAKNRMLRLSAAIDKRLTELSLTGADLPRIAEAVWDLAHKPCAIVDEQLQVLASHQEGGGAWDPNLAALIAHADVSEQWRAMSQDAVGVLAPFLHHGMRHRLLVGPCTAGLERLAFLLIEERGSAFGPMDRTIARHAATVVALERSAARRARTIRSSAEAALAGDLLRGGDVLRTAQRAADLGFAVDEPHIVCLFSAGADGIGPEARAVAEGFAASALDRRVLCATVTEGVAAIVQLSGRGSRAVELRGVVTAAGLVRDGLESAPRVAISAARRGVEGFNESYRDATAVAAAREALRAADGVTLSADELGPVRVLLAGGDPEIVDRFLDDALGPLLAIEAGRGDYFATLRVLLSTGLSARRASEVLGVHENTIRYRATRIQEILGIDLEDHRTTLTLQVAMMICDLRQVPLA